MADSNKREVGNFVTFSNANSSHADPWMRATSTTHVREAPSHTFAFALGALRASGGLLEFRWDADHQT